MQAPQPPHTIVNKPYLFFRPPRLTYTPDVNAAETASHIVVVCIVEPGTADITKDHGMVICDSTSRARHVNTFRLVCLPVCKKMLDCHVTKKSNNNKTTYFLSTRISTTSLILPYPLSWRNCEAPAAVRSASSIMNASASRSWCAFYESCYDNNNKTNSPERYSDWR